MKTIVANLTDEEAAELEPVISGRYAHSAMLAESLQSLAENPKTPRIRSATLREQHKAAALRRDALEKLLTALREGGGL